MKMTGSLLSSAAVFLVLRAMLASGLDFERYSVILQRKPFGDIPVPAEEPSGPPAPSFAQDLRLSGVVMLKDGVRASIVNDKDKRAYWLKVGQSEDGMELASADFEAEEATLRKGSETAVLKLSSGTATPAAAPPPRPAGRFPHLEEATAAPPGEPIPPGSRGATIDRFLQEHPEAVIKGTLTFPPPDLQPAVGKGETIERLLKEMGANKVLDE